MLPEDVAADLVRIDEQVLVVPGADAGGLDSLLVDDGEVVLLDAGLPDALAERLAPHVDVCVLTHCHAEHARAARHFREVWAPASESAALEGHPEYVETYGVQPRDRSVVEHHLADLRWIPRPADRRYRPGGMLQLGSTQWRMVHAPGHSTGMTLFLEPKRHYLFASDLGGTDDGHYGYPASDVDELIRSLEKAAGLDVAVLLTSRDPPRRRGIRALFRAKADSIRSRDLSVLERLDRPRTLDELAGLVVFPEPVPEETEAPPPKTRRAAAPEPPRRPARPPAALDRYARRVMVEKHLARLIERGLVAARQDGRYQRVD